ncbi:hypothetical protein RIF29_28690 [Crotalaria pallida]|uniref:Uncharacterized protein n=1 Tax=Crotalaria pallida TaxID=3830 RepID=A0AAN9EDL5_CROPI
MRSLVTLLTGGDVRQIWRKKEYAPIPVSTAINTITGPDLSYMSNEDDMRSLQRYFKHGNHDIWLRMIGVPLHACNLDFFNYVTAPFGDLVKVHLATLDMLRLDQAWLLVRCKNLVFMNSSFSDSIHRKFFEIRCEEIKLAGVGVFGVPDRFGKKEYDSISFDSDGQHSFLP